VTKLASRSFSTFPPSTDCHLQALVGINQDTMAPDIPVSARDAIEPGMSSSSLVCPLLGVLTDHKPSPALTSSQIFCFVNAPEASARQTMGNLQDISSFFVPPTFVSSSHQHTMTIADIPDHLLHQNPHSLKVLGLIMIETLKEQHHCFSVLCPNPQLNRLWGTMFSSTSPRSMLLSARHMPSSINAMSNSTLAPEEWPPLCREDFPRI
jgi:hypothetical protein